MFTKLLLNREIDDAGNQQQERCQKYDAVK